MSASRRDFLKTVAAGTPLPFFVGCEGFVEGLDLSAEGQGTGFTGGYFVKHFLSYRVVPARKVSQYRGTPPVVTAMLIRELKQEQANLKKVATEGQRKVIPKVRRDAQVARQKAASYRAKARVKPSAPQPRPQPETRLPKPAVAAPSPAEIVELEGQANVETRKAENLESQAAELEAKARKLLEAVDSEIGTIFSEDALHAVHIPSGALTKTVYRSESKVTGADDMVVQTTEGILPVVEG